MHLGQSLRLLGCNFLHKCWSFCGLVMRDAGKFSRVHLADCSLCCLAFAWKLGGLRVSLDAARDPRTGRSVAIKTIAKVWDPD